jgi:porin
MYIAARAFVLSTVCVAALSPNAVIRGQEPTPSPLRASSDAIAASVKRDAEIPAAQAGVAKPAQPSAPEFFHQEELTGDWNGTRTKWKNKGVELESSLTQFYQGVASGGIETGSEYNGTVQAELKFDLGKLAGWNYWLAEVKAETVLAGPCSEAPARSIP